MGKPYSTATTNPVKPGEGRLAHAGADHPVIPKSKIGILIANLGTPDATDYWSMRRYLSEFLSDQRVIDAPKWKWQPILQLIILTKRPFSSGKAYRSIWNNEVNESPLLTNTRAQTEKLRAAMTAKHGDQVQVEFCMRYGNPSIRSVIEKMKDEGCERIVFMPLYPQYSATTTATANDEAFRALMQLNWQPAIRTVPAYYNQPLYIDALAKSVEKSYQQLTEKPDLLVASYHGMPIRYLTQGDPYHCHCVQTTRLLRTRLGWSDDDIQTTFQSRFGLAEWLQPYTVEHVARLAKSGKKNIAIISPAFSSDCIETLEEINEEIRDAFIQAGGETFTYIPCLNDDDAHIEMMLAVLSRETAGWLT